jgi:hypothetical protein
MPKSRTHSKKKISSFEGLEILRNWQTHKTVLWFVSFAFSDVAGGPDMQVVSVTPNKFVLRPPYAEDPREDLIFDVAGVEFWALGEGDIPIRLTRVF